MRIFKYCVLVVTLLLATNQIYSQGPGGPPPPSSTTGAPIDGGIGLLLAAGIAYGVKTLRKDKAV